MSNRFPVEYEAWKNDVARRLVALRGSVDDIWRGLPQIPDPEIGVPFTGPLSPVPFVFPEGPGTGGTNTGGTVGSASGSGCPGADTMETSYVLSGCLDAGTYNISMGRVFNAFQCRWEDGTSNYVLSWIVATRVMTYSDVALTISYRATVDPPNPGDSVVLSLLTNFSGCTVPGTITITGV